MIPNVTIPEGSKGRWTVSHFEIGQEPTIETLRLAMAGRGIAPGKYTRLSHEKRGVITSDTTAEKRDHYPFVLEARGHCLVNGLGIGMCLNAALQKEAVDFVTVIEIEQDVIDLVWPHYEGQRCEVIHASAFDYQPPKGVRYGAVWHDIWDSICADNLPEMHNLHRKYGRRSDWQGSWGRSEIEAMRRREKNTQWRW